MARATAQLVKWGNSQAVRIPKYVLEQANLNEGDEIEIRVKNGRIEIEPVGERITIEALVAGITRENLHGEQDWGRPVGNEVW